ncbi:MAG TPA: biopolymer transporter ExbD [Chthoniobacterales bacterium]|nr:biopolymer transporter ExbD [Chthoniobacterales bacterium]
MRRFSDNIPLHTLSELNVTPLLDLAFVLLIIFMITTPLLENSIELVVPSSSTAHHEVNPSQVQTISIDRQNIIKINQELVSLDELSERLRALKADQPNVAVVVRPHRDLPIQQFIGIMDKLQQAGITKVGVMTRPEEQGSKE